MVKILLKKLAGLAFKTVAGRWVTVIIVTGLLAFASAYVIQWKHDIQNEVRAMCHEETLQANIVALNAQIESEQKHAAELEKENEQLRAANSEALQRRIVAEGKVTQLLRDREQQASEDETYREWSGTPAPDGVFDRLRKLQSQGPTGADSP